MASLNISNFPDPLLKKLKNRLENLKSTGREKGDLRAAVIEAIEFWLKNAEIKVK